MFIYFATVKNLSLTTVDRSKCMSILKNELARSRKSLIICVINFEMEIERQTEGKIIKRST